jgi:hypothetical protein
MPEETQNKTNKKQISRLNTYDNLTVFQGR